jgi:hypothetical protein
VLYDLFDNYPGAPSGRSTLDPTTLKVGDTVCIDRVRLGAVNASVVSIGDVWITLKIEGTKASIKRCLVGSKTPDVYDSRKSITGQLFRSQKDYNAAFDARSAYCAAYRAKQFELTTALNIADKLTLDGLEELGHEMDRIWIEN